MALRKWLKSVTCFRLLRCCLGIYIDRETDRQAGRQILPFRWTEASKWNSSKVKQRSVTTESATLSCILVLLHPCFQTGFFLCLFPPLCTAQKSAHSFSFALGSKYLLGKSVASYDPRSQLGLLGLHTGGILWVRLRLPRPETPIHIWLPENRFSALYLL